MAVHCYLVWDEVTRDAALFDTGWDAAPILDLVEQNGLQLRHIFITHSHGDHIAALGSVRERFPRVRLHSSSSHAPVDQRNRSNDFIHLGSLRITNRPTPGHADDGVTYVIGTWPEDAPNVAIVGDCVFAGSIGKAGDRLDLARQKVVEQVFSLPPDTLICPGHGPVTTVGEEKANNPFFS
jgi:glyoxylase-like metal-dependent hydrolase (beta-lactamase superfamily II)